MRGLKVAFAVAAVSGLVSVVLAIAVNLGTGGTAPEWLQGIQAYAWPTVGVCALLIIALSVAEVRLEGSGPAPTPAPDVQYAHLPPPPFAFAGRKREFSQLVERLEASDGVPPKVNVAGKPGVGKTALALAAAQQLRDNYRDAQLFLDLGGTKAHPLQRTEILARLLDQLGVPSVDISFDDREMAERLRTRLGGLKAIIVLDDAGSAEQVRDIVRAATPAAFVVTSRVPLPEIVELELIMLGCMSERDSVALLEAVVGHRIVRESDAARQLAVLCGNLPLALRIAAAVLSTRPGVSVAVLVEELRDEHARLDMLRIGDLEVRGSFNLSYRDLSDSNKAVFRRSSAIPGATFDSAVAAAAAEAPAVRAKSALDELARLQLLDVDEDGRFSYHDLIHLFAVEKLEQEEGREAPIEAARRSTRSYIAELRRVAYIVDPEDLVQVDLDGNSSSSEVDVSRDAQQNALEWLVGERPNIVASMNVARQMHFDDLLVDLGAAIRPFGLSGFPLAELVSLEESAVQAGLRRADDTQLARVLFNLGRSYRHRGRAADALRYLVESLEIACRTGPDALVANLHYFIGHALRENGQAEEARQSYAEALDRFTALGWTAKAAAVMSNLGLVEDNVGNLPAAEGLLRVAVANFEEVELSSVLDRREQAWSQQALGGVLMRRGKLDEAIGHLRTALELFETLQDRQGQVYSLRDLGDVNARNGRLQEAAIYFDRATEIGAELGDERGHAQAVASLAILDARRGHIMSALRRLGVYCRIFFPLRDRGRIRTAASLVGYTFLAGLGFRVAPRFPRSRRGR